MPSYIIKPTRDEDFYVVYSTIVDTVTYSGTRAEIEAEYSGSAPDRFERADEHGTSAQWGNPPAYGWDEDEFLTTEGLAPDLYRADASALVKRTDLRRLTESRGEDGYFRPPADIIRWEVYA